MSKLSSERCIPCERGTPPLTEGEVAGYLAELKGDWKLTDKKLCKEFSFRDFREAMNFVNRVADVAEREWHHPDIYISFNKVRFELYTHSIKGLSKNDFVLAAKIGLL